MSYMNEYPSEDTREHKIQSVSEALSVAKRKLESIDVTILGEVSEVNNKSGYKAVYFTVKDEQATLPCMIWMNRFHAQGVDLRVGLRVEIDGRFTLYAAKGRMSFDVSAIRIAGEGDLRMRVAALAKKLQSEGLMESARKRKLPIFPETIGIVTSPRGAVVHDILRTLRRRYPLAKVKIAGVPVEGSTAPQDMIRGLHCLAESECEVIILARGGGSFEDLMPFNDEQLARAIAACPIPVITGIGHEPDTTIADMVADMRASTPTAAAESISIPILEIGTLLYTKGQSMSNMLNRRLERSSEWINRTAAMPLFIDPHRMFANDVLRLDSHHASMERISQKILDPYRNQMALQASRLHDLSPLTILQRGYSIARDDEGKVISSVNRMQTNQKFTLSVSDGKACCTIDSIMKNEGME